MFASSWRSPAADVRIHQTGRKNVHHPVVGDLDLTYEAMTLASERGLLLLAYGAEPGSASGDALRVLASWAATNELGSDRTSRAVPGAPTAPDEGL